jgi:hypothetical protein
MLVSIPGIIISGVMQEQATCYKITHEVWNANIYLKFYWHSPMSVSQNNDFEFRTLNFCNLGTWIVLLWGWCVKIGMRSIDLLIPSPFLLVNKF